MVDPGYNWTGFYVGLNGGYSWGRANTTIFPNSILATSLGRDVNGGLFGGQIGYNWQVNPKWVLGLEPDGTGIIRSHPILGGLHHHYVRV
jgi:outer membrane immunogenic protein